MAATQPTTMVVAPDDGPGLSPELLQHVVRLQAENERLRHHVEILKDTLHEVLKDVRTGGSSHLSVSVEQGQKKQEHVKNVEPAQCSGESTLLEEPCCVGEQSWSSEQTPVKVASLTKVVSGISALPASGLHLPPGLPPPPGFEMLIARNEESMSSPSAPMEMSQYLVGANAAAGSSAKQTTSNHNGYSLEDSADSPHQQEEGKRVTDDALVRVVAGFVRGSARCTRAEWSVGQVQAKLRASSGFPLVSPPFVAAGLPPLRLMFVPGRHWAITRKTAVAARKLASKKSMVANDAAGAAYGSLKVKAVGADTGASAILYFTLGSLRLGPFSCDFSERAVQGCDIPEDWASHVQADGDRLCLGVEIE